MKHFKILLISILIWVFFMDFFGLIWFLVSFLLSLFVIFHFKLKINRYHILFVILTYLLSFTYMFIVSFVTFLNVSRFSYNEYMNQALGFFDFMIVIIWNWVALQSPKFIFLTLALFFLLAINWVLSYVLLNKYKKLRLFNFKK